MDAKEAGAGEGVQIVGRCHAAEANGHAQLRTLKHRRWTEGKRRAFLEHLGGSANVAASAAAAGISKVQVYRIRRADPAFRREWDAALREACAELELLLLHRARFGATTDHVLDGRRIRTHRYSDAMALKLLIRHQDRLDACR